MSLKVNMINLAHFEFSAFKYLLSNIFPEFIIIDGRYSSHINSEKDIYISFNLGNYGNINFNGVKKNGSMTYYFDDQIKSPIIFCTGENYDVNVISSNLNNKYLIISPYQTKDNVFTVPWIFISYIQFHLHNYIFKYKNNNININKDYLLAYCASRKTNERTKFMNLFIEKSNNKDKIYCLGKCQHSNCSSKKLKNYQSPSRILVDEYSKFKFVLAMENCEKKGYITEKLLQAFIAGTIPIYWGDHEYAKKIFNPKSFICIRDFDSMELCIDNILSMSEEQIECMLKEPMFIDNKIPDIFDITNFEDGSFYGNLKKMVRDLYL